MATEETRKTETILTQWKTCVEMADSVSQRRDVMNNIFVTINIALMATVSITWNIKSVFILLAGIVLCILWMLFIRNYKMLNKAKFDIIHGLEEQLPSAPFKDEWKTLCSTKKYVDGTKLEKILPVTFIALYGVAIIVILSLKIINLSA